MPMSAILNKRALSAMVIYTQQKTCHRKTRNEHIVSFILCFIDITQKLDLQLSPCCHSIQECNNNGYLYKIGIPKFYVCIYINFRAWHTGHRDAFLEWRSKG